MAFRVRIVGRGRVGKGLARALRAAGVEITRTADVILLAVPDSKIATVAAELAPTLARGSVVLHCAGSLGPSVLAPCRTAGAHVGVMHPLASFADRKKTPELRSVTFVIGGDRRAVAKASRIAKRVGARPLHADVHGPAYHAAAALAANGAAALADDAVHILRRIGLHERDAQRAIGALLRTVGENVERVGVPGALTGPIVRGDEHTVRLHRGALHPLGARAYDAIAPAILESALRAGLSPERAEAIRRALSEPRLDEPDVAEREEREQE